MFQLAISTRIGSPRSSYSSRGLLLVTALDSPLRRADVPTVAVASNLNFALEEIAAAFKQHDRPKEVKLAFGASGNFSRQIREGAPFELFLSADEAHVNVLADAG